MTPVERLLQEIDSVWRGPVAEKTRLNVIGASALLLQTQYRRGTKDGDILETADLKEIAKRELLRLAGKNTPLHARHRVYIDIVANGVPFLPRGPRFHRVEALTTLRHFEVVVLDIVDVVVSKLKRFSANDQSDIEAMFELGHVSHALLVSRFRSAVDAFTEDARAEELLPRCIDNLHRVERDLFDAAETDIELPGWF